MVSDEAVAPWSRTRNSMRKRRKEDLEGQEDVGRRGRKKRVVRAHALALVFPHPAILQNGRPLQVPQQYASRLPNLKRTEPSLTRETVLQ